MRWTVATALFASLSVAVLETSRTTFLQPGSAGLAFAGRLFISLAGFYLLCGLVLGTLEGIVIAGIRDFRRRTSGGEPLWRVLKEDPATDARLAGAILAAVVSAGLLGLVTYATHAFLSSEFANQSLAAVFLAGVAAVGTAAAAGAFFPLAAAFRRAARHIPRVRSIPVTVVVTAACAACGTVTAVFLVTRAAWKMFNFNPLIALGLMLAMQLVVSAFIAAAGERIRTRMTSWWIPVPFFIAASGSLVFSALALDRRPNLRAAFTDRTYAGPVFLRMGRSMTDADNDGFGNYFGGGDCDDANPKIHPGARDRPGDGVDQDCMGGDRKPPASPVHIDRKKLAPADPMRRFRFNGNLLILWIDALRADRIGITKYGRKLTPNLDRLFSRSVYFKNAYAQSNRSPHSYGALLTSRYPTKIKWQRKRDSMPKLASANLTLFEVLKDAGYRNVAAVRHYFFRLRSNVHQGFAKRDWHYAPWLSVRETVFDVPAPWVTKKAIQRLEALKRYGKKFALLVQYPDPHRWYIRHKGFPVTLKGPRRVIQKYDYEIAFADRYIGRLLKALKDLGLDKSTAVMVFSDHGEAFGEHRYKGRKVFYHGQVLYEELVRVPLAFCIPGIGPKVVHDRVMLIDAAPTLLDVIGRPIPKSFTGSSLVPYFFGRRLKSRPIRAETLTYRYWNEPNVMMIKGRWKIHYRIKDNLFELYDLKEDPAEKHDLASKRPDVVNRLKAEMMNY